MNKLFWTVFFCLISYDSMMAQKLGDHMNIDGVDCFVIHVDESGQHGLVMSYPAIKEKNFDKTMEYMRKHADEFDIDEETLPQMEKTFERLVIDYEPYQSASGFKTARKEILPILADSLGENGKENQKKIIQYCKDNNINLAENLPWEDWAEKLGDGWFIPGRSELKKYAKFRAGGIGSSHQFKPLSKKDAASLSDDVMVQRVLHAMLTFGFVSSSFSDHGPILLRCMTRRTSLNLAYWMEWYVMEDGTDAALLIKEKTTEANLMKQANVCAVHEF